MIFFGTLPLEFVVGQTPNCLHISGDNCEEDIDECAVKPCLHNSTCENLINDYNCLCWDGYDGKNCQDDIAECDTDPCQHNATCYELSDESLYAPDVVATLPDGIKEYFLAGFSWESAAGYRCNCPLGFEGNELISKDY